jgi:hypothetical protein
LEHLGISFIEIGRQGVKCLLDIPDRPHLGPDFRGIIEQPPDNHDGGNRYPGNEGHVGERSVGIEKNAEFQHPHVEQRAHGDGERRQDIAAGTDRG